MMEEAHRFGCCSAANALPVANDDAVTTVVNTTVTGNVADNDVLSLEGSNVITLVSSPQHGTVQVNADGSFAYVPSADYTGLDNFTYAITDASGDVSTAVVSISILGVPALHSRSPLDGHPLPFVWCSF
jgi:hypothetical protein